MSASDTLLPGISFGSGRDRNDRPVVHFTFDTEKGPVNVVLTPRQVSAFCALARRQADLAEGNWPAGPLLRVVP